LKALKSYDFSYKRAVPRYVKFQSTELADCPLPGLSARQLALVPNNADCYIPQASRKAIWERIPEAGALAGNDPKHAAGRFFLADPSLMTFSGHCFSYLFSLAPILRERGQESIVLGNRDLVRAMREEHGVIPAFSLWCDQRGYSWPQTRKIHERDILDGLREVSRSHNFTRNDILMLNTLRHWSIRGVVDWLEETPAPNRPAVVMVLHFTGYPDQDVWCQAADYYRDAFRRIEKSSARDRIVLFADSEELIDEYRDYNPSLTVHLAPIPHIRELSRPRPASAGRRWRIGYAGEARLNKGFDLIPYLAERIEAEGLGGEVELHIHTFCQNPAAAFYAQSIGRLNQSFVVPYPDVMDDDEYYRFIESIDLMLIPYTRENYHSQTSGIFAEAMGYGQVVAAPRGTWMSRQLKKYGGGRTFIPDDPIDLAEQVLYILRNRDAYQTEAAQRAGQWLSFHNPHSLLRRIDETVSQLQAAA
jgi:hypothetical protein